MLLLFFSCAADSLALLLPARCWDMLPLLPMRDAVVLPLPLLQAAKMLPYGLCKVQSAATAALHAAAMSPHLLWHNISSLLHTTTMRPQLLLQELGPSPHQLPLYL
jgi:hypothetical protein